MKRNVLSRGIALLLAMVLALSGCAAGKPGETTAPNAQTTAPNVETTAPAPEQPTNATDAAVDVEWDITFFSVNLNLNGADNRYLLAYPNDDGTVYVEYVGDVKKVGTNMDASVMEQIAAAVTGSGL